MRTKLLIFLMLLTPFLAVGQQKGTRTIRGSVVDAANGEPLIGATVFLDPDNAQAQSYVPQGTVTDLDGKFTYTLPAYVTKVVVSFIGYETKYVDVAKSDNFNIKLAVDSKQLEEAVVTGFQKIEPRKVTSSVQTVKMDDIERIGVASVDQLLEGQVAGLSSIPTNGAPGAPNKLRIRSTVSLSGNTDPLWVLDGMILEGNDIPSDFSDKDNIDELYNTSIAGVNPADIETITVLKDAAATAIYGARAANGVIVVTTKKGRVGKPRVNFSGATFYTLKPDMGRLNLMDASQKVDYELGLAARKDLTYRSETGGVARILNGAGELGAFQENGFSGLSAASQSAINDLRNINTNWGDIIYRNAWNQQYNLSVSGGGDLATYYFSGGYFNEQGATKNTGFDRFNMTMKVDFKLHEKLNVGTALFFTQSTRKSYLTGSGAHTNPARYSRNANPYLQVYDENGKYVYDQDIEGYNDKALDFNFVEEMNNTKQSLRNRSIKPMVTVEYNPFKFLTLSSQLTMQIENNATEKFADKNSYYTRQYREMSRVGGKYIMPEGGIIQNWNENMTQYQARFQGEFSQRFAERHEVDVMAGVELRGTDMDEVHTKGFGYDPKALTTQNLIFPEGSAIVNDSRFKQYARRENVDRYLSYYMTASYTFDEKYTFFGSVRHDGSNLFGVDRKYRYLPLWSFSGAWNMGREQFMQNIDWVSAVKWRLSYGLQGNVDKNTSPYVIGEWGNSTLLPGVSLPTVGVSSPPNPYLRWEQTSTWNGGLDLSFFRNRINLSVDAYHRNSKDLIGTRELPGENGFESTQMNWARLTNKGVEVSLSTVNVQTPNFRWSTDFNIAHNKSEVTEMHVKNNSYEPSKVGYSVGAMFALKTNGLDENGLPIYVDKNGEDKNLYDFFQIYKGTQMGGFIEFIKSDLSPEQFRELFTYVGTVEPKFTGGFTNKFRYKNWDLAVVTNFSVGQTVQETPFYHPTRMIPGQNNSQRVADIWSPTNTDGIYPGLLGSTTEGEKNWGYLWFNEMDPSNSFSKLDIWYKKINYIRVNSIRLGYNVPTNVLSRVGISNARLSMEARNPFVFGSSYKGYFDPETYGNMYAQPIAKTYSVGVDLTF
ncbi:MAG: SusC/RagA family TonB-linked outer membrane protein [Marinifilaceae bacterium]